MKLNTCFIISSLLVPISLLALFFGYVYYTVGFVNEFRVLNQSGESIIVTPIGKWEVTGKISLMPIYLSNPFGMYNADPKDFMIKPGKSRLFAYDDDDCIPQGIIVKNKFKGETKYLENHSNSYSPIFTVNDISNLIEVNPNYLKEDEDYPNIRLRIFNIVQTIGFLNIPVFIILTFLFLRNKSQKTLTN